jgi:DNA mismatch repair protein MutL
MPIHILSEDTINKIAAGEVIERPANAVKELVENSLDAGSRNIEIEFSGSGMKLIRVRDDGRGMGPEELGLAFKRHATSKITDFNDLHSVLSLGFRGEALPSIASVSKITAQSQSRGAKSGEELKINGGKPAGRNKWAGTAGTNIEVAELFYNTPARLKFMKSESAEKARILNCVEELALARPDVGFKVTSDGKTVLRAPAAKNIIERAMDVLGSEFASSLVPVAVDHPKLKVTGFITPAEKSRPNRNYQFIFVNKRPVQMSKAVYRSVYDAYSENLPKGRHPGLLLFIDVAPAEVDVNVHPAKREVKLANEGGMYDLFYRAIKTALNKPAEGPLAAIKYAETVREAPPQYKPLHEEFLRVSQAEFPASAAILPRSPYFQAFGLYLVAQKDEDILIIDQHAAAERIRYEKYLSEAENSGVAVQPMLLPVTLELPASGKAVLDANKEVFEKAGWDIEEFGAKTYRITGVPSVLGTEIAIKSVLEAMLEALAEGAKLKDSEKLEKIIRAACRKSIKAGDTVSGPEIERLLRDLFACRAPYTCPHGRPTVFKITRKELEKHFGRA